jgi:hypothetical protein
MGFNVNKLLSATNNKELQFKTVKPILRSTLEYLMTIEEFAPFRLVGGTSLS